MIFQIVTNLDNGAGLEQDYGLLKGILESHGHTVRGVHMHKWMANAGHADVNVFLEVIVPGMIRTAPRNWFVPNSEWYGKQWDAHLPNMTRFLCKTQDCLEIWQAKVGPERCRYIGWAAKDLYRPEVPREPVFLHLAGKSTTKNTAAVMEVWKRFRLPYQLTVSAYKEGIAALCRDVPNVRLVNRFCPVALVHEMNRSQFFVMPSKYEGYGHAIHEALGCGALVITTDGEPMRSFAGVCPNLLVAVERTAAMSEARVSCVNVEDLHRAVTLAAMLTPPAVDRLSRAARAGFLADNAEFHVAIRKEICAA